MSIDPGCTTSHLLLFGRTERPKWSELKTQPTQKHPQILGLAELETLSADVADLKRLSDALRCRAITETCVQEDVEVC